MLTVSANIYSNGTGLYKTGQGETRVDWTSQERKEIWLYGKDRTAYVKKTGHEMDCYDRTRQDTTEQEPP